MRFRPTARAAVAALVLLFVALTAASASAHSPTTSQKLYDDGSFCVLGKSQIAVDHATGDMTASAWTDARVYSGGATCDTIDVFPPWYLAVRYDLQRWNGSAWANCRSTGWVQNDSTWTYQVSVSNDYGDTPPCGKGYYRTQGTSLVWDGTAWRGGTTTTPYHPLPPPGL